MISLKKNGCHSPMCFCFSEDGYSQYINIVLHQWFKDLNTLLEKHAVVIKHSIKQYTVRC